GQMNVVMFAPEDLNVVKGSPQMRRRFLDMEIGQISPTYLHDLLSFQKILKQRNHLLKKNQGKKNIEDLTFDIYTEQYVTAAVKVIRKRFEFMELLQKWAAPIHESISRGLEKLEIHYKPIVGLDSSWTPHEMEEYILTKLKEQRNREFERGVTLVGPHRD
ncbi:MAG: DNA replication and repair protein RecF, partial [Kurthia sp.]